MACRKSRVVFVTKNVKAAVFELHSVKNKKNILNFFIYKHLAIFLTNCLRK